MNTTQIFNRAAATNILKRFAQTSHRGGYSEAIWLRDLTLLAWIFHHPERLAELFRITWKKDNTGHLFKEPAGNWMYHNVQAGHAMLFSQYAIAQPVACLIEPYLQARPLLLKKESDSLFYMPSNHLQHRINTLLERNFGRAVSFSEIRGLAAASPSR
jgi:hypothetical protein